MDNFKSGFISIIAVSTICAPVVESIRSIYFGLLASASIAAFNAGSISTSPSVAVVSSGSN